MRKLLLFVGLAVTVSNTFAQKLEKMDDVKEKIEKGKYDEAKEKLDKVFTNPQANSSPDALFYKAVVWHNLAKQKSDTTLANQAFDAIRSYVKMEEGKPEGQRMLLSTLENHKTLADLYQTYFAKGVENFQKQTYVPAFYNFEKALEVFNVLTKNNITNQKFDTTGTLYAGYSAQNAKMYDQAARYYDQLINNNINDTSYVGIYRFMINSNLDRHDTVTAKKYLGISQQRFPQYKDVWLDYQTLFMSHDKDKRFDEYEELIKANPGNEQLALNYAIELYNHVRASDAAEKDQALRQRTESALKQALSINPNSATANLLMSQFHWTELYQLQTQLDAVRGTTPAATAKKKEINTQMDAVFDKVFPYLTKSHELYSGITTLKPQDKANFKIILTQLVDYHTRKKQMDKATAYQAKIKTLQ
jgi:tetratricopeptide (TPR) repeat protein